MHVFQLHILKSRFIQVWFKNRRAKYRKRVKCGSLPTPELKAPTSPEYIAQATCTSTSTSTSPTEKSEIIKIEHDELDVSSDFPDELPHTRGMYICAASNNVVSEQVDTNRPVPSQKKLEA